MKYKIETETIALCNQLNEITKILGNSECTSQFLMEMSRIKNLGKIAENKTSKTYFLPYNSMLSNLVPIAKTLFSNENAENVKKVMNKIHDTR